MIIIDEQAALLINGGCGTKKEHPWYEPNKPKKDEKPTPCSLDHIFRPKPHSFSMVVYGSLGK